MNEYDAARMLEVLRQEGYESAGAPDQADLIVVATPHDCYKNIPFRQPVIDITHTIVGAGETAPVPVGNGAAARIEDLIPYVDYVVAAGLLS